MCKLQIYVQSQDGCETSCRHVVAANQNKNVKRGSSWLLAKEKIWRDVHQRRRNHAKLIVKQVHVDMTSPNSAKIRKQRSNVPVPL